MNQTLTLYFIGSFVSLFSIVNPIMAAPVFVSLTEQMPVAERKQLAWRAAQYTFWILLVFFLTGSLILSFYGISLHALKIGGGLMILTSAFSMLNKKERLLPEEHQEASEKDDLAFSPIAMPLLSGPGAIAVIIGMTADAASPLHYGIIVLILLLLSTLCYWVFVLSERIVSRLGQTLVKSITRIMGFILLCVGVQFMVNGITGVIQDL